MDKKMVLKKVKPSSLILLVFLALVLILIPRLLTGYTYSVVNMALIYILCVYSASILMGMGGQVGFAYITFMGLGAYFTANVTTGRLGIVMEPVFALLLSPVLTGLIGLVIGYLLLHMKGTFFTFGTIGFVNVSFIIFSNEMKLFNGPNGISGIPELSLGSFAVDSNAKWFYMLMILVVLGYFLVERIRATKMGRALSYIKGDETAALCMGIHVFKTKVYAFTIAAVLCGFAGSLYAMQSRFVTPEMYDFTAGTTIILMLMIGGVNHTLGVPIGAVLLTALPEIFRELKSFLYLGYGVAIILLMIFFPSGIAGLGKVVSDRMKKVREAKQKGGSDGRGIETGGNQ